MQAQLQGWTTRRRGLITAQPEPGHNTAVVLDSTKSVGSNRFDAARFEATNHSRIRITFRGSPELRVFLKLTTTAGARKFLFTPDDGPLTKVSGTQYRMGLGATAASGEWSDHIVDIASLVDRVDPGISLTELVRIYVRVRDQATFDPPSTLGPDIVVGDPGGPGSRAEAARFLVQATFGPSASSIDQLMATGSYADWIDEQFALPVSTTLEYTQANSNGSEPTTRHQVWWNNALRQPDQLRQRVAFALSEIFVISDNDYELSNSQYGICHYYDMLARHATGNFRDLLTNVTLHPAMGVYLGMVRNQRADPARNIRPDENFARELLQLFTIGLTQLDASGVALEVGGAPVPTFDQTMIESFARVFTGWNFNGLEAFDSNNIPAHARLDPMTPVESFHDQQPKLLLNGLRTPASQTALQDLDAALDNIFEHANVGPFIGRRLVQRLVTSNPSPAYVGRVAAAFNNNGDGVRGDIAHTVKAVLLDPEARPTPTPATFGKPREPIMRLTHLWRAMEAVPGPGAPANFYRTSEGGMSQIARFMAQAPVESPSVFNFFTPDYSPGGSELVAPEMQILTESNLAAANNAYVNMIYTYNNRGNGYDQNTVINIEREVALADDPAALLEHLDVLLLGGTMPPAMRSVLGTHIQSIPISGDGAETRALDAVFAVVASPAYCIQK